MGDLHDVPELDGLILADGFDKAVIGKVARFNQEFLVYDLELVIDELMAQGLSYDEAVEYWDYNMVGAWVGEATPGYLVWAPAREGSDEVGTKGKAGNAHHAARPARSGAKRHARRAVAAGARNQRAAGRARNVGQRSRP